MTAQNHKAQNSNFSGAKKSRERFLTTEYQANPSEDFKLSFQIMFGNYRTLYNSIITFMNNQFKQVPITKANAKQAREVIAMSKLMNVADMAIEYDRNNAEGFLSDIDDGIVSELCRTISWIYNRVIDKVQYNGEECTYPVTLLKADTRRSIRYTRDEFEIKDGNLYVLGERIELSAPIGDKDLEATNITITQTRQPNGRNRRWFVKLHTRDLSGKIDTTRTMCKLVVEEGYPKLLAVKEENREIHLPRYIVETCTELDRAQKAGDDKETITRLHGRFHNALRHWARENRVALEHLLPKPKKQFKKKPFNKKPHGNKPRNNK